LKVALVADPHANLQASLEVQGELERRNLSVIILAGDLVGYGPNPNEVIQLFSKMDIFAVRGNHDDAALTRDTLRMNPYAAEAAIWTSGSLTEESRNLLESLPATRKLELEGLEIGVFHGSPENPLEYVFDRYRAREILEGSELDVIVVGHTHVPMVLTVKERVFVNPGGVGQPRDGDPRASFAVLDLETLEAEIVRVPYDISLTQRCIDEAGLPSQLASRLSYGL
jgi:putative phosphoesterase